MRSSSSHDDALTPDERAMLDRAFARLLFHLFERKHGRSFYASHMRVEFVCAFCGEVVFEGPVFEDPTPEFVYVEYRPEERARTRRVPWKTRGKGSA